MIKRIDKDKLKPPKGYRLSKEICPGCGNKLYHSRIPNLGEDKPNLIRLGLTCLNCKSSYQWE